MLPEPWRAAGGEGSQWGAVGKGPGGETGRDRGEARHFQHVADTGRRPPGPVGLCSSGRRMCVTYFVMGAFWFLTRHWIEQGHAQRLGGQLRGLIGM